MKANIPKTGRWRIRVHDFDAWSAYYTIAKIISQFLKDLRKIRVQFRDRLFLMTKIFQKKKIGKGLEKGVGNGMRF